MRILDNVNKVQEQIGTACAIANRSPEEITIIGVTKYVDAKMADELRASGIINLGENRADVFLEKHQELDSHISWHFIGTLQTRKVRDVINKIDFLHSLDRLSLAEEINKRVDQKLKCFVQVNVLNEESKHGLAIDEVPDFIRHLLAYDKIVVIGLMAMAPETDDETIIRSCFSKLKQLQKEIQHLLLDHAPCTELSMGMTNDYQIAIQEGATFVRLGRCLFE